MDPHDLTAAYALDALDPDEAEAYERHLSQCEECREHLAELNETVELDGKPTVTPEVLVFELTGDGRIARVEVFVQTSAG